MSWGLTALVVTLPAFASLVFIARIDQRTTGDTFSRRATEQQPVVVRPLIPLYIAGTYGSRRSGAPSMPTRTGSGSAAVRTN